MSSNIALAVEDVQGDGRWMSQHNRIVEDCRLKMPDVLFVGDSIIQRMQDVEIWEKNPFHAVNAGISADQTQHVLYRLSNGILDNCSPKVVVVLVGTNNHQHTCEEVVEGLEAICWEINNKLPQAKILFLALLPRGEKDNPLRVKIDEINNELERLVPSLPNTYYLNADPGFVRSNDRISCDDMLDYLHPTRKGYKRMFPNIVNMVTKLLH